MKRDIHQEVTNRLIEQLERGVAPWSRPWESGSLGCFPIRHNGERYRGVNVLSLWCAAGERGYVQPMWMTYRQAQECGGQVRKGERSSEVVYVGRVEREGEEIDPETGEPVRVGIPFLKAYRVFNVEQIDGLPPDRFAEPPASHSWARDADAEAFFAATGGEVVHKGARAFYSPGADRITMPPRESFREAVGYYGVLAHEFTHWTGAPHRLDRLRADARFGNASYAFEELVAEIGAAFVMAHLGGAVEPREDHAAYLASWLTCLREDKRAIFRAATLAEAAVEYLGAPQRAREAA